MTHIYQWMSHWAPNAFALFAETGPFLLVLIAAITWYGVTQALAQRIVASRRERGAFFPRFAAAGRRLVRWLEVPIMPAATRAVTVAERLQILERIRPETDRAEVFTLPVLDESNPAA